MIENCLNDRLPFYPWSDKRLMTLPGTNKLNNEPLFFNCDQFKEQFMLRDQLVKTIAERVCIQNPNNDCILDETFDFILKLLKNNLKYNVNSNYLERPDKIKIIFNKMSKIQTIARILQEDILIHRFNKKNNKYQLVAGALCFPSHWTLSQKLGMDLERIHKPVPDYSSDLAKRVERLFFGLKSGNAIWRANWTVKNSASLYAPLLEGDSLPKKFNLNRDWWVRVERQTFNKLPVSGAVIFGIHTFVVSPKSLKADELEKLLLKLKFKNLIHH